MGALARASRKPPNPSPGKDPTHTGNGLTPLQRALMWKPNLTFRQTALWAYLHSQQAGV